MVVKTTQSEDTESKSYFKALNSILDSILVKSTTHKYLESFLHKNLTDEVIQSLKQERPELNSADKEKIITELLDEFQGQLHQNIPVAFVIKMIDEIPNQIDDHTKSLINEIAEIKNESVSIKENLNLYDNRLENSLRGFEDRVTDRVRGGLINDLSQIAVIKSSIDEIKPVLSQIAVIKSSIDEIKPMSLVRKNDYWLGIIAVIGLTFTAGLMLDSSLSSKTTSIEKIHSSHQDYVKNTMESMDKQLIKIDQRMQRI